MPAFERDPVSVLFDRGARRLLQRAYARPGTWQGTRLAGPSAGRAGWLASHGINPAGGDPVPGSLARTRWARGFVRALYYQHRWWSDGTTGWRTTARSAPRRAGALRVEVGRAFPGGDREVRVRLDPGGLAADAAVRRLPDSRRIYTTAGAPAGAWSDSRDRDW